MGNYDFGLDPQEKAHIAMTEPNRRLAQSKEFNEGFSKEGAVRAEQVWCERSPGQRQRGTCVLDSGGPEGMGITVS